MIHLVRTKTHRHVQEGTYSDLFVQLFFLLRSIWSVGWLFSSFSGSSCSVARRVSFAVTYGLRKSDIFMRLITEEVDFSFGWWLICKLQPAVELNNTKFTLVANNSHVETVKHFINKNYAILVLINIKDCTYVFTLGNFFLRSVD